MIEIDIDFIKNIVANNIHVVITRSFLNYRLQNAIVFIN